jgi:hypothetical protein
MLHASDLARLLAVFACSGIFWMTILFRVDRVAIDQSRPCSIPLANVGSGGLGVLLV